jgi:hypothetical protein
MAARTRSDVLRVNTDPAGADLALAEARDFLAQGNWEPAADLLTTTHFGPWDRRTHRVRVLADAVANSAWVERWLVLDPTNPDAALLRAQVETVRALRAATSGSLAEARTSSVEALQMCYQAADMAPSDPTPWVTMMTLARAADRGRRTGRDDFWQRWRELRARDEFSRDGHHEALTYLFGSWCGSHKEMYDFAYWLAGQAPPGSPLAVLPLVAHAEMYRAMAEDGEASSAGEISPFAHWTRPQVSADVERVLRDWLGSAAIQHAQADLDRNYLLHAMAFNGRAETNEARALFDAVGPHVTAVPWAYTGDPESSFLYWRALAFAENQHFPQQ